MSRTATNLAETQRTPRVGEVWTGVAANASGEEAPDAGTSDSPAVVALLAEVRALREQLGALAAERPGTSVRDRERLGLGRDAILSVGRAAELLPLADGEARAWLREQGLVATIEACGRTKELVHWGAVLEKLAPASPPKARVRRRGEPRGRSGLRRVDLG